MRKEAEILSHQLAPNDVISLLNKSSAPFANHISIPTGAAINLDSSETSIASKFTQSLEALDLGKSSTSSNQPINKKETELNFGSPQIDLSLPEGTLSKDGLHEFNPKHFKDQDLAFKIALTLAAREVNSPSSKPIFCFLTEDQTNLINWLSSIEIEKLGLSKENLILITAKHTDDLLWAMEETIHSVEATALVAHFTLLNNISAQRLAFAAKTHKVPYLLICNHKIDGPNHSKSKWTIWSTTENPNCETSFNQEKQIELTLSQIQNEEQNSNWTIKWQAEKGRFVTSKKETEISATFH